MIVSAFAHLPLSLLSPLHAELPWLICLIDTDGNGYISCNELNDLFKAASLPLPGYRVREITENLMATGDLDQDGKISFDEFIKVSMMQKTKRCICNLWLQFKKYLETHSHSPCFNITCSLWFSWLPIGFLKIHYTFVGFSWPKKHRCRQDL